jgi:glycosyltransferase involved in cell wall biosynthesis
MSNLFLGNRPMYKVVQLTTVHQWDDVRIYHKMSKSLAGAGYDVHVVAPAELGTIAPSVTLHPLPMVGGRLSRIWKRQPLALRQILKLKPDVVHFHDPELLPLGLLLRFLGYNVIYDVHEDVAAQIQAKPWIALRFRAAIGNAFRIFERMAVKCMSATIVAIKEIGANFNSAKFTEIKNYPKLSEFTNFEPAELATQNTLPFFVYVGGLTEVRGIKEMVSAIDLAKSKPTLLLGGKFDNKDFYSDLKKQQGWKNTDFKGWLNRSEVAKLLDSANAGLLTLHPTPNHMTSLPIKMFEYFAAGKPIIASDFQYWRNVSGGNCIFVNPLNPQEIADAMDWICNNPLEASEMGKRGQKLVTEECNWEKESEKLLTLYSQLLAPIKG